MNRKLRPKNSFYQIKEEQINFLLEDVEKKLGEYKKAIELKDKQLAEANNVLQGAKKKIRFIVTRI